MYCSTQLCEGGEELVELFLVTVSVGSDVFFQIFNTLSQFFKLLLWDVGEKILSHTDEGAHDVDVDFDGFGTPEDTGKHGDALFGEGERGVAGTAFV